MIRMDPSDTPILLVVWRRPNTLRQVLDALRPVAPKHLYVACDGPADGSAEDAQKVAATRRVIDQEIDWPCQISTLYSNSNLGCSIGPIRAITWFFDQVEEGIILEDDCVPHIDFFRYCSILLDRFRFDTRVWCISGNNFQDGLKRGDGSYYFSRYNHCWGWASWRRCWQHYDPNLTLWPLLRDSNLLETIFDDPLERRYWTKVWERTYSERSRVTWWDYQWTFACLINGGLTVLPNVNLVSNVGFGSDSSHFPLERPPAKIDEEIGTLIHPHFLLRDIQADHYTFEHHFLDPNHRLRRIILPRLKAQALHYLKTFFPSKHPMPPV